MNWKRSKETHRCVLENGLVHLARDRCAHCLQHDLKKAYELLISVKTTFEDLDSNTFPGAYSMFMRIEKLLEEKHDD